MDTDEMLKKMTARLDFQIWLERMGYNRKQVSKAAATIGMTGPTTVSQTSSGTRELTYTERLAMAAVRAGLPAWTPETDQEIADMAELRAIVTRLSVQKRASDDEANAA